MTSSITELRDRLAECWTLCVAIRYDIFNNIGSGADAKDLASKMGLEASALDSMLNALAVSGYLDRSSGVYHLSDMTRRYLVKDSSDYIGAIVNIFEVYERLKFYGDRLHGVLNEPTDAIWDHITDSTSRLAVPALESLVGRFPSLKADPIIVIDVGCGDCRYLNTLGDMNPNASLIGIEKFDSMAKKAERNIRHENRTKILQADFVGLEISDAGMIMFNNLFHIVGDAVSLDMLRKSYSVLRPGGKACILEPFFVGEYPSGFQAFFDMNMRLSHKDGKCYRKDDLLDMIADSGFDKVSIVDLSVDTPNIAYFVGER